MNLSLIAALDRNSAIGRDNTLPWHLPDDLKWFKAITLGKPVLMGRKTAQSLGRALPGRINLVMTRGGRAPFPGMQVVTSLDQALAVAAGLAAQELCVIGGATVYALALGRAARLYLTCVDTAVDEADTWFPAFDLDDWDEVARSVHPPDARHQFGFSCVEYWRRAAGV